MNIGQGTQPNYFNIIRGLSFDGQGHLYTVDRDNNRVQKFGIVSNCNYCCDKITFDQ